VKTTFTIEKENTFPYIINIPLRSITPGRRLSFSKH